MTITTFTLTSPTTQAAAPFMVGLGFKKGDVPASFVLNLTNYQVLVKRRWNDGSVKHAIVTGRAPLTANVPKVVSINTGTPPTGTNLTSASIAAAAPTASVQCGAIGTVSLATLLATPFRTWLSGPEVVECHYRADVGGGTNLAVWFHVRLFADGRMWARAIVENGYLDNGSGGIAVNTDQTFVPTVIVGGNTVYDNGGAALIHPRATRWMAEGWIGVDPAIVVANDVPYLRASRLLPNYVFPAADEPTLNGLVQVYTPEGIGNYNRRFEETGYQNHIALLPIWTALYGSNGDPRARASTLANSGHLNTWPIVWRDKTTKNVPKPSSFPTWSLDGPGQGGTTLLGAGSGANLRSWEVSHHPGESYLAYIITGEYWHYETMLSQLAIIYFCIGPGPAGSGFRGNGTSRKMLSQTRGTAWVMRSMVQVASIFPTGDDVGADYQALLNYNASYWKTVVDTPGLNNLGYIWEYDVNLYAPGTIGPWQQHYWIQSMGFGSDLDPLADMTAFVQVRDHMYKAAVGILGGNGVDNYCYTFGSAYNIVITSADLPDPTTWFNTWGEVFTATYGVDNLSCGLVLGGTSGAAPTAAATGFWGTLMPAIAMAVDHSAPNALVAWNRMVGASNWAAVLSSNFNNTPIWGIEPRDAPPPPSTGNGPSTRVDTASLISGAVVVGNRGLGVLGQSIPSTGLYGASYLWACLNLPADANAEVQGYLETVPSSGVFYAWEDGSMSLIGAADGVYTFRVRLKSNGVDLGTFIDTIAIGAVSTLAGNDALDDLVASGFLGVPAVFGGSIALDDLVASGLIIAILLPALTIDYPGWVVRANALAGTLGRP